MIKTFTQANWLQGMEGDVNFKPRAISAQSHRWRSECWCRMDQKAMADRSPVWVTRDTEYGLMLAARRNYDDADYYWRINQWLMPYCTLVAGPDDKPYTGQLRVPVDDRTTMLFRVYASRGAPLTQEDHDYAANGIAFPEMSGPFEMKERIDNDYLIDREDQKLRSFSGIKSVVAEDLAVTEDQDGPIADRSRELLTSADAAIVALRRRFLGAAKALREGKEPPQLADPRAYRVRSCQLTLPARNRCCGGCEAQDAGGLEVPGRNVWRRYSLACFPASMTRPHVPLSIVRNVLKSDVDMPIEDGNAPRSSNFAAGLVSVRTARNSVVSLAARSGGVPRAANRPMNDSDWKPGNVADISGYSGASGHGSRLARSKRPHPAAADILQRCQGRIEHDLNVARNDRELRRRKTGVRT